MRRDNKDILIGLVGTLTDEECKELYYYITGKQEGYDIEVGRVHLTNKQYNKLIWMWGEDKTSKCIKLLDEWLESKGDKISPFLSHYKQLITWIDNKYYQLYPASDKSLRYDSKIDTAWKAKRYIASIPPELRRYDCEVKFLLEKFGKEVLP